MWFGSPHPFPDGGESASDAGTGGLGLPPAPQGQEGGGNAVGRQSKKAKAGRGTVSTVEPRTFVLYGESIELDQRLARITGRERFLLSVVMPRYRTFRDSMDEWYQRSTSQSVVCACLIVLVLHVAVCLICSNDDASGICAGGPVSTADWSGAEDDAGKSEWLASHAFVTYGPPMINVLASLILSFYANLCMTLFTEGYFAAQELKESVLDVTAMVTGTIPRQMIEVQMEFWRCVNLYHISSYVLADKSRETYNLDNFLIPVSTAYGEYNGRTQFGMLKLEELKMLTSDPEKARVSRAEVQEERNSSLARAIGHSKLSNQPLKDKELASLHREKQLDKNPSFSQRKRSMTISAEETARTVESEGFRRPALLREAEQWKVSDSETIYARTHGRNTLTNSRGDVSSHTAVLHAAIGIRLYMLVDLVLEEKLSRAAWPAWNSILLKLRANSEKLKQRALFRLPRIYQASVRFLVAATVLTDTWLLASHAGQLLRHSDGEAQWRAHACFGALIDFCLNLMLTWCLAIFLDAITDMQTPFGGDFLDMPGLSYACAASELSLRMVQGANGGGPSSEKPDAPSRRLFEMLNGSIDRKILLRGLERLGRSKGKDDEEEEEEEEDEDGGDE